MVSALASSGDIDYAMGMVAERLLQQIVLRDEAALKRLYDKLAPAILALGKRMLRSPAEAEELVQETFVEVWRRAEQYHPERGSAEAWIYTVARNRAVDRLRARGSMRRALGGLAVEPMSQGPTPLEEASARQDRERIAKALIDLPSEQRLALELAFFEGLTHSEVAERTSQPLGTVKTRIRTALGRMAAVLGSRTEQRS
jgi:RNA polymerase sigma-70 factor (ECF subfamily)